MCARRLSRPWPGQVPLDRRARRSGWRVHLHFYPDRVGGDGESVLESLVRQGVYRSQFETGTGNGGLTAHPGGDRWRWESWMFGTAYDDAPLSARPKYGALDHRGRPRGAAPRFGSAYLRLNADTLARTTFCYPDSVFEPVLFGVAEHATAVIDAARAGEAGGDPLDDYVEAHVHGPVLLARDVEVLVLDPCFRGTEVETAASALPCPVVWHPGFRLSVDDLRRHPEYRGPRIVAVGEQVAADGMLDARIIGRAASSGRFDVQDLKKVWHHVARWG